MDEAGGVSFPDSFQAHVEPLDQMQYLDREQYYDLWDEFADDSSGLAACFSELARHAVPRAFSDSLVSVAL